MFEIGQKIICVDASKAPHTVEELNRDCPMWVKENERYTVRAFLDSDFVVGVLLEEIVNPIRYFSLIGKSQESSFATWRFRSIKEDEVSLASEAYSAVV